MQTEFKMGVMVAVLLGLTAPIWLGTEHKCPALQPDSSNITSEAIPAFARKYNVSCEVCHTIWPRLTRTGYEFRRLGYRMPYEVVAENKPKAPVAPATQTNPGGPITQTGPGAALAAPLISMAAGDPVRGKAAFEKGGCAACHGGGGNVVTPSKPIKGQKFLEKYPDADSMAKLIRAGVPGTAMTAFGPDKISDSDLSDMIAYIRSLTPAPN